MEGVEEGAGRDLRKPVAVVRQSWQASAKINDTPVQKASAHNVDNFDAIHGTGSLLRLGKT